MVHGDSCVSNTLRPNKKWTPKQIAITYPKLITFVGNFKHKNCESRQEE